MMHSGHIDLDRACTSPDSVIMPLPGFPTWGAVGGLLGAVVEGRSPAPQGSRQIPNVSRQIYGLVKILCKEMNILGSTVLLRYILVSKLRDIKLKSNTVCNDALFFKND